jgi:hypothetical protein
MSKVMSENTASIFERLRRNSFRQLLFGWGARANIPYSILRTISDSVSVVGHLREYTERKNLARRVLAQHSPQTRMTQDNGYLLLDDDTIPELASFIAAGQGIYERKKSQIAIPSGEPFTNILTAEEFRADAAFWALAVSPTLIGILSDYLGSIPRLRYVQIWYSEPVDTPFESMLYHLDRPDFGHLGLCINLIDTTAHQGPFSFLPRSATNQLRKTFSYDHRYNLGNGRIDDREIASHISGNEIVSLIGPAGSAGIVDTSNCFHLGSRCENGVRVMAQLRYTLAHTTQKESSGVFDGHPYGNDRVRMLLLDGAQPGAPGNIEPILS